MNSTQCTKDGIALKLVLMNAKKSNIGNIDSLDDILDITLCTPQGYVQGVSTMHSGYWEFHNCTASVLNKFIVRTKYNEFTIR